MLIPYRCKNPYEHVPYATFTLIGLNVLFYLFTTNYLLEIKPGIVADYAVAPGALNPLRLLVSMFLHGQPFHLIGNMWFLWLFGAAAEGRLRTGKYLLIYFVSGVVGGLAQYALDKVFGADVPGFGADGAVMGIAGAYLYMFPFARIMVFRFFIITLAHIYIGPAEWLSWWVVAFYAGLNVFNGLLDKLLGLSDFLSYFAHVSGVLVGILMAILLRARRDSELMSQAQAVRADVSDDLTIMTVFEMESILESPTEDMELVLTYCSKVMSQPGIKGDERALKVIEKYKQHLVTRGDTLILADIVLKIPIETGGVSGPFYLRLGGKLEQMQQYEVAAYLYRRVYDLYRITPDAGASLIRLGRIWEKVYFDFDLAFEAYSVYLEHYVTGPFAEDAQKGVDRLRQQIEGSETARRTSIRRDLTEQPTFTLLAEDPDSAESNRTPPAAPDLLDSYRTDDTQQ